MEVVMRLEEYEAKHLISYKHDDIESMRQALATYRCLLESGKAFEDDYCVCHFNHEGGPISEEHFEGHPALKAYLVEMAYYYNESAASDVQSLTTTEELFFLCAVIHPELEADIAKTCQALVDYAQLIGDSSEMWITCETAFGVSPLQIVAMQYPKYGYLLASFLVACWDEEHMPYHLEALYQWVRHVGVTDDSIKAYCYCDNAMARQSMLGYDIIEDLYFNEKPKLDKAFDLLTYLRETANGYERYVEIIAQRCKERPPIDAFNILFEEDQDENEIFETFIAELLIQHHPEVVFEQDELTFDLFATMTFIDSPAKDAVDKLKSDVEELLGGKISSFMS